MVSSTHALVLFVGLIVALVTAREVPGKTLACKYEKDSGPQSAPVGENYTRLCLKGWAIGRWFSLRSAPVIAPLLEEQGAAKALRKLTEHFKNSEKRVLKKLEETKQRDRAGDIRVRFDRPKSESCNLERKVLTTAVNAITSHYGWGVQKGLSCVTELVEKEVSETLVDNIREYIMKLGKTKERAVLSAGFTNWKNPSTYLNYTYKSNYNDDSCSILHIAGFRVDGKWRINTGITNDIPTRYLEDNNRFYMVEILHEQNGRIKTTNLTLPTYLPAIRANRSKFNATETSFKLGTSTLIAVWGGVPTTSLFTDQFNAANNPGVLAALELNAGIRQSVNDATTLANMAIIIAPLVLALIPIALFSDVGTFSMMAYLVVTDILSAIPLFAKGIELLIFDNKDKDAVRTWMYGQPIGNQLAAAEMWYAECNVPQSIRIKGHIFISLSLLAMVIGVTLELFAKRFMERRRAHVEEKLMAEWEIKAGQLWARNKCMHCVRK